MDETHPKLGKRELRVGPRMQKKYLEMLMEQINKAIIDGQEKQWRNPRLVLCEDTLHPADSPFTREDRHIIGGYRDAPSRNDSFLMN